MLCLPFLLLVVQIYSRFLPYVSQDELKYSSDTSKNEQSEHKFDSIQARLSYFQQTFLGEWKSPSYIQSTRNKAGIFKMNMENIEDDYKIIIILTNYEFSDSQTTFTFDFSVEGTNIDSSSIEAEAKLTSINSKLFDKITSHQDLSCLAKIQLTTMIVSDFMHSFEIAVNSPECSLNLDLSWFFDNNYPNPFDNSYSVMFWSFLAVANTHLIGELFFYIKKAEEDNDKRLSSVYF